MGEIRPRLTEEEYGIIQQFRGIKTVSSDSDLNSHDVKHGWIKSKNASLFFTNPEYEQPEFDPDKINWDFVVKNIPQINKGVNEGINDAVNEGIFDRLVYTDTHIGMNPNPDGYSLYGGKWDETEVMKRLTTMIDFVTANKKSDTLIVDDLGDLLDGWDGRTARREHELPQNMDNQKAFDVALNFKYQLFVAVYNLYDKLLFNNICIDNHAGAFGYIVNSAFKKLIEATNPKLVEVVNHRKFINHYKIGDNVFVISHGKDDKNLKFGFKPQLDKVQTEKINNYIDEHYLLQPNVRIEFSKGDSHQMLFDWSTSDRFNYHNYPAFSPASNWIQTNYKKGKSGFVLFNYHKTDLFDIKPYFFKWEN
jgi:hypothetical protein